MQLLDETRFQFPIDVGAIVRRSHAYVDRCEQCLALRPDIHAVASGDHPLAIVSRLSAVVTDEIIRAFAGWLSDGHEREELATDPEGAAALALNAIEHSRQAWLALVHTQQVRAISAAPLVTDLVWLKHEIARAFPGAID